MSHIQAINRTGNLTGGTKGKGIPEKGTGSLMRNQ